MLQEKQWLLSLKFAEAIGIKEEKVGA